MSFRYNSEAKFSHTSIRRRFVSYFGQATSQKGTKTSVLSLERFDTVSSEAEDIEIVKCSCTVLNVNFAQETENHIRFEPAGWKRDYNSMQRLRKFKKEWCAEVSAKSEW